MRERLLIGYFGDRENEGMSIISQTLNPATCTQSLKQTKQYVFERKKKEGVGKNHAWLLNMNVSYDDVE